MDPIKTRFSNIEALRHSEVDVQALKAHGQIEVGGKSYEIRAAANDELTVERSGKPSKFGTFFKSAGSSSQSDQIAQLLNDKRGSSVPRFARQGQTHLDRMLFNIEEGQSSSAATSVQKNKQPNGRLVKSSLLELANEAKAAGTLNSGAIYKLYAKELPRVNLMPPTEHRACLAHMYKLNGQNDINIWPQNLDQLYGSVLKRYTKEFMKNDPEAPNKYYRIERSGERIGTEDVKARLTVNVKPEFHKEMVNAAVKLTAENRDILGSKVAGPGKIGTTTDAAVFYVGNDFSSAQALAQRLKELLPSDAFINHTPAGMQCIEKGLCYAERVPGDDTSHGMSRARIISSALADTSRSSIEKKLGNAFKNAGYNPDNPAFTL
ncbi:MULTISPECIES: T3SS effector HopA1 family protein [Pseudomonas syringae group]|uniref:Type III effector n=4 Tax=Pseudomonas syringae group TaxID=136849 RepID=A0AAD0DXG7_9PSED|nr:MULTISPECIES: T3SS effector HopA1 family protein [Pseudomonas syringae group]AVB19695.1 type III effector [Pseudomonas avellanae]EGH13276.1 type III effector HopA1 [Pseudomonas amygdali pv. morsprunorum str. M302280]KWS71483.1 type III effector [Pseudomonas amygdali pv. morsprunorum]PHN37235.1 type III effector [Pseudomonas avellanae]POC83250.1 type III effector [Pseudomonas avellanae]